MVSIRAKFFNIQQLCILPTRCVHAFCVILRINSEYFPKYNKWSFVMVMCDAFFEVGTESLNVIYMNFIFQRANKSVT